MTSSRRFERWDRVKAVRATEDQQCLYSQRYGTVMDRVGEDVYDVLLDQTFRTFYEGNQLEAAEPQRDPA